MKTLNASTYASKSSDYPVTVLQFGEGNFLRAFVDFMLMQAHDKGLFNGSVAIVKPIEAGALEPFLSQDNLFTVIERGIVDGKPLESRRIVDTVRDVMCAYADYERFMSYARSETLTFIISNTTEAGIVYDESDVFDSCPPRTYPGKLAKLLYERYLHFDKSPKHGLYILPCELIENNGVELRRCVQQTAENWRLGADFLAWLDESCSFHNTLVDRITTGWPGDAEAERIFAEIGYEDRLLDCCEPFFLWVIENKNGIADALPLDKAGLDVIFTDDVRPYRDRKVYLLNGSHTLTVLAAYLAGFDYVGDFMENADFVSFLSAASEEEVLPYLDGDPEDLHRFADAVTERFRNPYIRHPLLSIALNSISKWKARILPPLLRYVKERHELPRRICFSFAALCAFYRGTRFVDGRLYGNRGGNEYIINDEAHVLSFFHKLTEKYGTSPSGYIANVMGRSDFWGMDLREIDGFEALSCTYLERILSDGAYEAMKHVTDI